MGTPLAPVVNIAALPAVTACPTGCVVIPGAAGTALTVKTVALLVAVPALFVATSWNSSLFIANVVGLIVSVPVIEPEIAPPSVKFPKVVPPSVESCHCSVGVGVPLAAPLKFALCPTVTDWFPGCVVMFGATAGFTVSVPASPTNVPAAFVAESRNWSPDIATVVLLTVSVAVVVPV